MTGPVRARGELLRFCGQFCKRYGMLMSGQVCVCVLPGCLPSRANQPVAGFGSNYSIGSSFRIILLALLGRSRETAAGKLIYGGFVLE
jgi:hypothetical protein